MRRAGTTWLIAAVLLAVTRLCTGIVYRSDEPLTALVLRPPAWAIERTETAARPMESDVVIDSDEPDLVYGGLYMALMHAAPIGAVAMAAIGASLLALARRTDVAQA